MTSGGERCDRTVMDGVRLRVSTLCAIRVSSEPPDPPPQSQMVAKMSDNHSLTKQCLYIYYTALLNTVERSVHLHGAFPTAGVELCFNNRLLRACGYRLLLTVERGIINGGKLIVSLIYLCNCGCLPPLASGIPPLASPDLSGGLEILFLNPWSRGLVDSVIPCDQRTLRDRVRGTELNLLPPAPIQDFNGPGGGGLFRWL